MHSASGKIVIVCSENLESVHKCLAKIAGKNQRALEFLEKPSDW